MDKFDRELLGELTRRIGDLESSVGALTMVLHRQSDINAKIANAMAGVVAKLADLEDRTERVENAESPLFTLSPN